jgi:hypothetical protein
MGEGNVEFRDFNLSAVHQRCFLQPARAAGITQGAAGRLKQEPRYMKKLILATSLIAIMAT